jgi:hypothetical protein
LKKTDPYDRLKMQVDNAAIVIRGVENDKPGTSPLYQIEISSLTSDPAGRWLEGAPVLAGDGKVVGILSIGAAANRMVLVDGEYLVSTF